MKFPLSPLLLACCIVLLPAPAALAQVGNEAVSSILAEAAQAREQGDVQRERALLEQGLADTGPDSRAAFPLYDKLTQNHSDNGDFVGAIRLAEQQLATAGGPAQRLGVLVSLISLHASLHQMNKAQARFREAEALLPVLRSTRGWARKGDWWQALLARAKAMLEGSAGHLAVAESAWKACLGSAGNALKIDPDREGSALFVDCSRGLIGVLTATGQLEAAGQLADRVRQAAERVVEINKRPGINVRVQQTLGHLAMEQGRFDEARRLFNQAIDTLQASGSAEQSTRMGNLRKQMALLAMLKGDWSGALAWHEQRADGLRKTSQGLGPVSAEYAYTLVRLGRSGEAVAMLRKIVAARARIYDEASLYLWESRAFLGLALAAHGQSIEALAQLQAAMPKILDIARGERSSADAGVLRSARLNWLLDGYIALLAEQAASTDHKAASQALDEAFRMADLARGSTVQRALAAAASRTSISDPALAEVARREQDLQREISALAEAIDNLLARGRVAEQDQAVADMRATLARLHAEHTAVQAELERRFPDYAALLSPKPIGIASVQKLLKPSEALIAVYAGSQSTVVWAVPASGAARLAVVPLSGEQLDLKVGTLRQALDPNAEAAGRLPKFPFAIAHELYARLLAPVEAGWQGARELIVVPHGRLGQLPFGLLTTQPWQAPAARLPYAEMAEAPWLLKQVAISQLPAAVALPALRAGRDGAPANRPFVGFGDPQFGTSPAPAPTHMRGLKRRNLVLAKAKPNGAPDGTINFALLPPLPDTALEIRDIASVLTAEAERDVFLQGRASEAQVKKADLAAYRVVMFATHGLMSGEMPGLYQPALALSNPALTGDGEDGMLTMEEILGLKLHADWVVLSACNTAAAGGQSGESVSGLGRAFFYAGSKALLVTNWAVETESARLLTTDIFRRQAADPSLPRARALQQAALALMKKSAGQDYSYAHPMFWAPYTLVGDGG